MLKQIEADKHKLIRYNEIIKTLSNTWSEIRANDDQFTEVKLIEFKKEGEDSSKTTEEGLIEMIERVKIREEEVRETKRIKEELQKQDVKRGEAMMKKQNVVMYTGKPAFIEWAGSITKLLEQLPDTVGDVIICSFVKETIVHTETFKLILNYNSTNEVMKIIGELHSTDKSVIKEAFTSIRQMAYPTTYGLAFQNAQAILRKADILESIGIKEAVELAELDVCVKKGIHEGTYQRWLDYSHDELEKLAKEDANEKPEEQTDWRKKESMTLHILYNPSTRVV